MVSKAILSDCQAAFFAERGIWQSGRFPAQEKSPKMVRSNTVVCFPSGRKMNRNEVTTPSVNLFPLMALSVLTLLGVIAGVVMLLGLHNKMPKQAATQAVVSADEIGKIELVKDQVLIHLMKRNDAGKLTKTQEIELPLENFGSGYERLNSFLDQLIEKGIITEQE